MDGEGGGRRGGGEGIRARGKTMTEINHDGSVLTDPPPFPYPCTPLLPTYHLPNPRVSRRSQVKVVKVVLELIISSRYIVGVHPPSS